MTGSNKILTVSYGTFSCTLEGFDEPFETMRGIAEYFRDLAADDRYFGAEPPTPDVEMLQSIAQREVQRRVEARASETGIALTQAPAPAPSVARPAPRPERPVAQVEKTPPAATFDSGPLAFDDDYLMADEPEDILTVDETRPPAEETDRVETVAEKLRRIRAVVSRSIEPGDAPRSFSSAPSAEAAAGAQPARDRANTQTINAITADLSDEDVFDGEEEEDVTLDEPEAPAEEISREEDLEDLARLDGLDAEDQNVANVMAHDDEPAPECEPGENAFSEDIEHEDEDEPEDDSANDDALIASVLQSGMAEPGDVGTEKPKPARASEPEAGEGRKRPEIGDTDGNVDRLLRETDNQLADDAGIRRRRVISQMRAAVAATKAERILSPELPRSGAAREEASPYKDDLKKVITRKLDDTPPKRSAEPTRILSEPGLADLSPEAQAPAKPPPLVLVSSQRVDEPESPSTGTDTGGFREFARKMGASELPDLMEAAAAYASFVEGQSHFTRPEIMKRVAAVDPALEISREAGLRSFGQLLRQGKIRKLDRGQFVVDEDTRFHPSQRIAGE